MKGRLQAGDWIASFRRAMDRDRSRIARLLHDEVGQVLSAAGLQMDLLRMDCRQVAGAEEQIAEAQKLLERALVRVRELSYDLNPAIIERLGLEAACKRLVDRFGRSFRGKLAWSYCGDPQTRGVQAQALYRIAEEALQNAVEHSGAGEISISVEAGPQRLKLEVRDNGRGFACERALTETPAVGLRLMKLEAETAGMELRLASEPQRGTMITVLWPPERGSGKARKDVARRAERSGRR